MLDLTYIHHSSFLLRQEGTCSILFDYWKPDDRPFARSREDRDKETGKRKDPWFLESIPTELPFFVVVSHHHKDHYNPAIFDWKKRFPNIRYILSKDTARFARHLLKKLPSESVQVLEPGDVYSEGPVEIHAFGSTDIGNSYGILISKRDGSTIKVFHAGDLNSWLWLDESTPDEIADMRGRFSSILEDISREFPKLDLAMFPVDSRLGRGYEEGASLFVHKIDVARFFPMHFSLGESEEEIAQRKKDARNFELYAAERGEYIALQQTGDRAMFNN